MNSCSPSSFSRCATAAEMDGGDTAMRCDADAIELASAAATKYCRWRRVKRIYDPHPPPKKNLPPPSWGRAGVGVVLSSENRAELKHRPHPNPPPPRGRGFSSVSEGQ